MERKEKKKGKEKTILASFSACQLLRVFFFLVLFFGFLSVLFSFTWTEFVCVLNERNLPDYNPHLQSSGTKTPVSELKPGHRQTWPFGIKKTPPQGCCQSMLIRRIQSSGWFSESIMCFEIPWIFIMIIQARTSCYLVTHGCLSILTRTQREGQGKKIWERETTMGKQDKIFLPAVLFLSTRCVLTPHVCGFEMRVARAIFLPLHPWKNT